MTQRELHHSTLKMLAVSNSQLKLLYCGYSRRVLDLDINHDVGGIILHYLKLLLLDCVFAYPNELAQVSYPKNLKNSLKSDSFTLNCKPNTSCSITPSETTSHSRGQDTWTNFLTGIVCIRTSSLLHECKKSGNFRVRLSQNDCRLKRSRNSSILECGVLGVPVTSLKHLEQQTNENENENNIDCVLEKYRSSGKKLHLDELVEDELFQELDIQTKFIRFFYEECDSVFTCVYNSCSRRDRQEQRLKSTRSDIIDEEYVVTVGDTVTVCLDENEKRVSFRKKSGDSRDGETDGIIVGKDIKTGTMFKNGYVKIDRMKEYAWYFVFAGSFCQCHEDDAGFEYQLSL